MRTAIGALTALLSSAFAQDSQPLEGVPLGLWMWSDERADPTAEVTLARQGRTWSGTIDGEDAAVTKEGRRIVIESGDGHRFVGEMTRRGRLVEGLWHQPQTDRAYSHMVTPAALTASGRRRWRAEITEQERPFRVFVEIFEHEEGEYRAAIRNPERGEPRRSVWRIEGIEGDRIKLVSGSGDWAVRREILIDGEDLRLDHQRIPGTLTLSPVAMEDAEGFLPRPEDARPARHQVPPQLDDGWQVASAEEAGFDRAKLDAMVEELADNDVRDIRGRMIHSVLAAHDGKLVVEEYFFGYDREDRHDTRSLGKVFAPVLIGALRQEGADIGSDTTPIPAILEDAGEPLDDPRKAEITLGQLMSFSSGLDCAENDSSPGSEDRLWTQEETDDFWLYTARLPVLHEPGTRHAYCSASINLAGSTIEHAGGRPIIEIFDELIAEPLAFGPYHWNVAPNGAAYLGGGPYMRPRDILKIGVMVADGGVWNGQRIIDEAFAREQTEAFIEVTPETTGMTQEEFNNNSFGGKQGYKWRLDEVRVGDQSYPTYEASGNGGQLIVVVPDFDLVVGFTGANYNFGGIWGRWRNEIIGGHLIPALESSPPATE
jgi:CubicO group peptidase (beta-lactamase class C family)